jgi:hypothetical protein
MRLLSKVTSDRVPCKCCGEPAALFGVVDFNKNCEAGKDVFPLPLVGVPVYYHRCAACKLIFTVFFDDFSPADFAEHVYNDNYPLVDPEYAEIRPVRNGMAICSLFGGARDLPVLDYGGGNGRLAEILRLAGFKDVTTYDPFVPGFSKLPERRFALILAYEVMEHSPTPVETARQLATLRADEGLVHFTTLLQPGNIDQLGLNWWYASPRNGHATLFSFESLQRLAQSAQVRVFSPSAGTHVFYTVPPTFAGSVFRQPGGGVGLSLRT